MDRRKFLVNIALVLGCSPLSINLKAVESGMAFNPIGEKGFSGEISDLIRCIADIIIPETETPSASQAGVPEYIHHYFTNYMTEDDRELFISGVVVLAGGSVAEYLGLDGARQIEVVQALDDKIGTDAVNATYKKLKELIVIGYYTSKIGATQTLRYDPVPGPYKEIKLAEVGRAWL